MNQNSDAPIELPALEYTPQPIPYIQQSQTIQMDQLGPVVVNSDGTLGRITNWHQMNLEEQANVTRVLSRRNQQRLERLARDTQ
jgi:hypothetical protein